MRTKFLMFAAVLALVLCVFTAQAFANGQTPSTSQSTSTMESTTTETAPPVSESTTTTTESTTVTTTPSTMATTACGTASTPEVDAFNQAYFTRYYGLSDTDLSSLRAQGFSWGDINFMANLSARTQRPISEIAQLRSQGMSWSDIAGRYNLALADISQPYIPTTVAVTSYPAVYGAGTTIVAPSYYLRDKYGNPVLTAGDADMYRRRGYDWQSIAIAANISAKTGMMVGQILAMTDRGETWVEIANNFGLNPAQVLDVSAYPFSREPVRSVAYQSRIDRQQQTVAERYDAYPMTTGAGVGAGGTMQQPIGSTVSPAPATTSPTY